MLQDYSMRISYTNSDKMYASAKDKTGHYVLDIATTDDTLKIVLKPSVKMQNIRLTLSYTYPFAENTVVFPNGYQSWTDSREMGKNDTMPPLSDFAKLSKYFSKCNAYGDYDFTKYLPDKGFFHGMSYGYIRNENEFELIGSLNERTGYTILYFNLANNEIVIEKDLQGLTLDTTSEYEVMSLFSQKGEYNAVFDAYFKTLDIGKPRIKSKCGYTSWYNYFTNINEEVITRDLESLSKAPQKLDIFQIDDGFQTATGDWLSIDAVKFPNGLKPLVENIHSKKMLAGLWLAPFAAIKKSELFKTHKDWFIKDHRGLLLAAGANWGGFYALDIYNPEVREYLKKVFDTVLNEWGFDMVKLDFLYAACIIPYNDKTRGEIMCDAMDLIRECCGDKLVLGCGVPLFPAFGKVDFCRIGCDVSLNWTRKSYFCRFHREDVGTENTLMSTIFRRHLDGRAFVNDPDVYLLREGNLRLTMGQKAIIAKINKLFGNLLFISDNIAEYTDEQMAIFNDTIAPCKKQILDAKYVAENNVYVKYLENGVEKEFTFNIKDGVMISGDLKA